MPPKVTVTINKDYDKEIIGAFLDEKDDAYDFGYERIIKEHPVLSRCRGIGEEKNAACVAPYVDTYYARHQRDIEKSAHQMQEIWDAMSAAYFDALREIFGSLQFYRAEALHAILSIAQCGVIDENGTDFQIWYKTVKEPPEVRRHFAHEILHFYYYTYVAQKGFANLENSWDLAEIFNVVILGLPAFVKITGKADEGYAQHEKYFAYYKALWRRSETLDAYLERTNSEGLTL